MFLLFRGKEKVGNKFRKVGTRQKKRIPGVAALGIHGWKPNQTERRKANRRNWCIL